MKRRCQTVAGVAAETMPRDDGWRFLMLGWMLERAEMTCRLLDVRYGELAGVTDLAASTCWLRLLKSASALEAYRKAYRRVDGPDDVVEFLLLVAHVPAQRPVLPAPGRDATSPASPPATRSSRPQRIARPHPRPSSSSATSHELLAGGLHVILDQLQDGVREVAEASPRSTSATCRCDLHSIDVAAVDGRGLS